MDREMIHIRIADLLDQIERIDRVIDVHKQNKNEAIAMSMVRQYSVGREEFVEQLNEIFKLFSLNVRTLERMPTSKKTYVHETLAVSVAHEPARVYGEKDNLNSNPKIED
jgi:hypothetical protein